MGTAGDVVRNAVRTAEGEPTIPYGFPESYAAKLSAPFAHAPDAEIPSQDPKEAIRRSLPKLEDQGPLGQTLANDVLSPAADIAQAGAVVIPALRGMRGAPVALPSVDTLAEQSLKESAARQSAGAAGATVDISKASPPLKQAVADARGNVNQDALQRHLEAEQFGVQLTEGQATRDPIKFSDERNNRGKYPQYAERFNQQNGQLVNAVNELRAEAAPDAVANDHIQNGQGLVDKYKELDQPARDAISNAYKELTDSNGGDFPVDGQRLVQNVNGSLKKALKSGAISNSLRSALDEFTDGSRPMHFEDFETLRSDAARDMRGNDPAAAQAAYIVRQELEKLPLAEGAANLKPLADKARALSKARFDAMDADPAYKAVAGDMDAGVERGQQSTLADNFVSKYLIKGKLADIQKMRAKFQGDPEAVGLIESAPLNYLRDKAGINPYKEENIFTQNGYNTALKEIEPRMDALLRPEIAEKARALGRVATNVQQAPPGELVNRSGTAVTQLREGAKDIAIGIANAKTGGLAGFARDAFGKIHTPKAVTESLKPGAGIAKE